MALSEATPTLHETWLPAPASFYPRNAIVFHQTERGGRLWYVRSGLVKIGVFSADGRERVFDYLGPGCFFGEHCLFAETVAGVTATVVEDARLAGIPGAEAADRIGRDPAFALALMGSMHHKLHRRGRQLVDAAFGDADQRVASALLYVNAKRPVDDRDTIHVSQQVLADLIGVSRVTVAYALAQLEQEGLIARDGRRLKLLDPSRLRRLALDTTAPEPQGAERLRL